MRIARIEIDPPTDLRDTVWTAVTFTFVNGAQAVGLVPTRYPGSEEVRDDALKLARRTEWVTAGGADYPLGQRMLTSDGPEAALMDVRLVEFDLVGDGSGHDTGNGATTEDTGVHG
jgi:type VI secretion system protein ImpE